MKTNSKVLGMFLMLVVLFVSTGCPDFERGFRRPACIYEEKTLEAYISSYRMEEDSIMHVLFEPSEEQERSLWLRADSYSLKRFNLDLNESTVNDTSIVYLIEGSFITQGTCSPSSIRSIKLLE